MDLISQSPNQFSQSPNQLLASLSAEDFEVLRPHLRSIELVQGTVLVKSDDPITCAYFPKSGMISLVEGLKEGELVEIAMVGRESVLGAAAALNATIALSTAIVQLAGSASVVDIAYLRIIAERNASFRATLVRHEQALFVQAQQSAACSATHAVEARLARWLLRLYDITGSDDMPLTQEFLSQMLAVRRSSVSLIASTMQRAGFISYNRGHVKITNLEGLRETACECYETVKVRCDRLLMNDPSA